LLAKDEELKNGNSQENGQTSEKQENNSDDNQEAEKANGEQDE